MFSRLLLNRSTTLRQNWGRNNGVRNHSHSTLPNRMGIPGIKKIIAVASGKGGVGKSTTAVNLALSISLQNKRVGILDADVYGPSIPMLMNLKGKQPEMEESSKKMIPLSNYGIKCMSMGFLVEEDSPMIWRGPMVMSALDQMMKNTLWGELDYMVIDLPPGTGDAQLSICQKIPLSGAVIVCTPQDLALLDAVRGANMFRKVQVPILGVVENMSYHVCEKCGEVSHIFGHEGAKNTAAKMDMEFLGEIPLHSQIRKLSDEGRPIVASHPDSHLSKAYLDVASRIIQVLESEEFQKEQQLPKITIQ
eukprot:TRINITY_DN5338_c0_g1_i1.p1 TRINITY_DN5338_c0_g1~~TRINITY_DN5338_c0_g1_i1.p1  ORF type:complete len:306 (+),score=79.82 TRINITY_DN5338_c0_g1_i1:1103-2020(+)